MIVSSLYPQLPDVEDLLAERGLDVSYETIRRWVLKFGPLFAKELRRRRHRPTSHWHLDEMAVLIAGRGAVTPTWIGAARDLEGPLNFRPRWRLATSGTLRLVGREACGGM